MHHERLITGVAAVFAVFAVVLSVVGVAGTPVAFPVALAFAVAAYLMYDQLSGRMAGRVYRRVEQRARANGSRGRRERNEGRRGRPGGSVGSRFGGPRAERAGGTGAGPRDEWVPPRGGRTAREAAAGGRRTAATRRSSPGPSPADRAAYETLGLDPGADEDTVRDAYRDLVKEVHPDAPAGSKQRFKAVKAAYEQLTE